MFWHVHTHVVLLPYHFFLSEALRLNSRGHHNNLEIIFLEPVPEAL